MAFNGYHGKREILSFKLPQVLELEVNNGVLSPSAIAGTARDMRGVKVA
jgi:hypothetical protein